MNNFFVTSEKIIKSPEGDVMRGIRTSSNGYNGFEEAYFSEIQYGKIKGWKRHLKMTLNLLVPVGKIKFVMFNDLEHKNSTFHEVILSKENYQRLTIPPMTWVAFQGLDTKTSVLLNIANIVHDPEETERMDLYLSNYDWNMK